MTKLILLLCCFLCAKLNEGKNYGRQWRHRAAYQDEPTIERLSSWSYWQAWSAWQSRSNYRAGATSNVDVAHPGVVRSFGGNSNGADCVFPFVYKQREYTSCTNEGREDRLEWCSTTSNYDQHQRYGFCYLKTVQSDIELEDNSNGRKQCQFPFIFKRKVYYGCTNDGMKDSRLWCSLDWDYDGRRRWAVCKRVGTFAGNSNGKQCAPTFVFQGKIYNGCTSDGRQGDQLRWCATTDDYDRDQKWGLCIERDFPSILAENRFFCALPFVYGKKAYYGCTSDGRKDGRMWCSLTHDYHKGKSWSFCPQRGY